MGKLMKTHEAHTRLFSIALDFRWSLFYFVESYLKISSYILEDY